MANGRVPQTLLFAGVEGLGKATLARRFATLLIAQGDAAAAARIENDDLSLEHNIELIAEREKMPAEKRNEDPLVFNTHPDFLTFAPDGPLRQIGIPQMRLLKERAQFKPLSGERKVILIDQADRAGDQAANALLKTLEEPPDHAVLIMTAENVYDLLPTIRSRSVILNFAPLDDEQMKAFARERKLDQAELRIALSGGSPGVSATLDIGLHQKRRAAMLALVRTGAGAAPFAAWLPVAEAIARSKSEKLDLHLQLLYGLLRDIMLLSQGRSGIRNFDLKKELGDLAGRVKPSWIVDAVRSVDRIAALLRRNIQKPLALDALATDMRRSA